MDSSGSIDAAELLEAAAAGGSEVAEAMAEVEAIWGLLENNGSLRRGSFTLCRQHGGREMLGCDDCGDWYHL